VFSISGILDYLALIETEAKGEIDQVLDAIGSIPDVEGTQSAIVISTKFDRH
jgi:DNA-binding Lrp family transcriptional regulator